MVSLRPRNVRIPRDIVQQISEVVGGTAAGGIPATAPNASQTAATQVLQPSQGSTQAAPDVLAQLVAAVYSMKNDLEPLKQSVSWLEATVWNWSEDGQQHGDDGKRRKTAIAVGDTA